MGDAVASVVRALIEIGPSDGRQQGALGDVVREVNLFSAAEAIRRNLHLYPLNQPAVTLRVVAATIAQAMGTPPVSAYEVGLLRAAQILDDMDARLPLAWVHAFEAATDAIALKNDLSACDRSLLAAMIPAARVMRETLQRTADGFATLNAAAAAARAAATRAPLRALGAQVVAICLEALAKR